MAIRNLRYVITALVVILSLFASNSAVSATEPVKIGILWPMSGPVAVTGEEVRKGFIVAQEEINANGGIKALGGAKVEFIFADTQGKVETGISEARRLIYQENVVALMGAWQSAVTIPIAQIAEQAKVPHLVALAAADAITERGFKYVFRLGPRTGSYARTIAKFLDSAQAKGPKIASDIALIYENSDFGSSTATGIKAMAPSAGLKIVGDFPYPYTTSDLTGTIARIKAANPDLIIATSYGPDAILIMRTINELKFAPRTGLIGTVGGYNDPKLIGTLGAGAENILALAYWNADLRKPEAAAFANKFRGHFGRDPIGLAAFTYSAAFVLKEAIEKAGKADREAIGTALSEIEITQGPAMAVPFQKIKFGSDGQNVDEEIIVVQVQNGRFVTVWPSQYVSSQLRWPAALSAK